MSMVLQKSDIDLELMPTGVREVIVLEKSSASTNLLLFFHCKALTTENTLGQNCINDFQYLTWQLSRLRIAFATELPTD